MGLSQKRPHLLLVWIWIKGWIQDVFFLTFFNSVTFIHVVISQGIKQGS